MEWEEIEKEFIPSFPEDVPTNCKVCACWNCNTIFAKEGKKKYCSPECSQEQRDADKRLKKTGTYLRPKIDGYLPNREENMGIKDKKRTVLTGEIDKYSGRKLDGNRPYSPGRNPDKPAARTKIKIGESGRSWEHDRQEKYEEFIRGSSPGLFTVNIATGRKTHHANGKKHEYSEKVQVLVHDA